MIGAALPGRPAGPFSLHAPPPPSMFVSMMQSLPVSTSLPAIVTAARAGALDHAWALYERGGYAMRADDPAALAVKGRLLKDRALAWRGAGQAALFAEAADAYAAADRLLPQPYTRINVATLRLLAGDAAGAAAIASGLLDWMDATADILETPYYIAATRAEAELVRGNNLAAEALLEAAMAHDPEGWSDHATTLRQFGLIMAARNEDGRWLDRFRPPLSMHFAGHLGISGRDDGALGDAVARVLEERRVGFGYGALAAGSDIVVAEALLAGGADLHVILPTTPDRFRAQSVSPYGADWDQRFNACLAAAASVRWTCSVSGAYEPRATELAADVAMGAAVLNARLLSSRSLQLLVIDDGPGRYGEGRGTARDGERWAAREREQIVLVAPRSAPVEPSSRARGEGRADLFVAAMVHVAFDGIEALDDGGFAEMLDRAVAPVRARIAASADAATLTLASGNAHVLTFEAPEQAFAFAAALSSAPPMALPLRIAAHYALVHRLADPPGLFGRGVAELEAIASVALPGALTASETFATALMIAPGLAPRAEPVGEWAGMRLFALRP